MGTKRHSDRDQQFPGVTSADKSVVINTDASANIYFGPKKPAGNVNWLQTIPGKGWLMIQMIPSITCPNN